MLYLAIDQHAKQITVCVRNEDGDTVLRRQVSTRPEKIEAFFEQPGLNEVGETLSSRQKPIRQPSVHYE